MRANHNYTAAFTAQVDECVETSAFAGADDLDALLLSLPGVYPTEVLNSLERLVISGKLPRRVALRLAASNRPKQPSAMHDGTGPLPVPHPLDYDWRFSLTTAEDIVDLAHRIGERIVCVGAPTVFSLAKKTSFFDYAALVDNNRSVCDHFSGTSTAVIRCNVLTDELPQIHADVVVSDPPWYRGHIKSFLWAASELCVVGGHTLIGLPMRGTRPGVQAELDEVFEWAGALGFEVCQLDEGRLLYETPPFERNALRAAGVDLRLNSWRRGTLGVFKKHTARQAARPIDPSSAYDNWDEASLFGTRFFFREPGRIGVDDPSLVPLVSGDVLPSVSRTHPLRPRVDVWTSGNRVYRCQSPALLSSIAHILAKEGEVGAVLDAIDTTTDSRVIDQAARMIQDLACMERDERQIGFG